MSEPVEFNKLPTEVLEQYKMELEIFQRTATYKYFLAVCEQNTNQMTREVANVKLTDNGSILARESILGEVRAWSDAENFFTNMGEQVLDALGE